MINPQWLELPLSRINFHGPKDVRAIEVLLYIILTNPCSRSRSNAVELQQKHPNQSRQRAA